MEGKNPREGCAALVLRHYHQRRAGIARIRQTWLPTSRIRKPDNAPQRSLTLNSRRSGHGISILNRRTTSAPYDTTIRALKLSTQPDSFGGAARDTERDRGAGR